jgi:C4-dicarboxylate-specific signal transduction histidine kinase
VLTLPIHCEGELWGFLSLDNGSQAIPLTDAETDSLRAVANILGATIARQHAQDALMEATQSLEHRVEERTRALRDQVAAEERARAELAQAQQSLIETSRLAGMAEVATSVLHNVGNVLNSVGVSATLVTDRIRRSKAGSLTRAAAMIRAQNGQLATFLTSDPKGRVLPEYLEAVCQQVANDHSGMLKELEELVENVEHIKKIVAMQQTYAKVSGTVENLPIADLVDDALRMNAASFESANISVVRQIAPNLPPINVDRHRVLQILINLLRNAKQALDVPEVTERRLEIGSFFDPDGKVIIRVRDTGVGIAPENMTRIFQHGFTTKKEGHGFGLHSGANVAKEMGGRLTAHSDGPGRGAVFTLELPLALRQPALP